MRLLAAATLAFSLLSGIAAAAEHRIRMLNYGEGGGMVFEPAFLRVAPGDTVRFVAETTGHNVRSYVVPQGVTPWNSALDEDFTVTLTQPGVYIYICPPHMMMAMLGVIQVGEAVNLDAAKTAAARLRPRLVMNAGRLDEALGKVE